MYQGRTVAVAGVTQDAYDAMMRGVISESDYYSRAWTTAEGQVPYYHIYTEPSIESSRLLSKYVRAQYACSTFLQNGMPMPEAYARAFYFFGADYAGVADLSQWWDDQDPISAERIDLTERQFLGLSGAFNVVSTASVLSVPTLRVLERAGPHNFQRGIFPTNPNDLLPEVVRDAKGRICPSDFIRIRPEKHPLQPGEVFSPRHHGQHYHIEIRLDRTKSFNNANNVIKLKPPGYKPGVGTGFLPGEQFP